MRVAPLVLACLAVSACAGGESDEPPLTKAQYEQRAGGIIRELPGADDRFDPASIDDRTLAAAAELAELTPPAEVRDEHLLLVSGLEGLGQDLAAVDRVRLEAGSVEEMQAALDRLAGSAGGMQVEDALRRFEAKGYRLPSIFGAG